MISWLSDERCARLPFGVCRACGDPVKRRGARLCATCWWAAHLTGDNQQPQTAGAEPL